MAELSYHAGTGPARAKRRKTGGRVGGTPNKKTIRRRLLAAIQAIGTAPRLYVTIARPATPAEPLARKSRPLRIRRCGCCNAEKPVSDFFRVKRREPNKGLAPTRYCAACTAIKRGQRRENTDAWRAYQSALCRRMNYGISPEEFAVMLCEQAGCCKVCDEPLSPAPRQLHVDHCHATKRVRGLLCRKCNHALGFAMESPERLRRLALYVEAF